MNRPYIFCHMMTSLDGKIMGDYMETPEGEQAGSVFYDIAFGKNAYYKHQGWLSGRVTTDDNFTFYEKPELDEISIVIAAAADGSTDTPALFSAKGDFAPSKALGFRLDNAEVKDGGSVWLRYKMKQEGANAK